MVLCNLHHYDSGYRPLLPTDGANAVPVPAASAMHGQAQEGVHGPGIMAPLSVYDVTPGGIT